MDESMSVRAGVAIVTGASRGIGRAIARELAKAGYDVAVNYRDRESDARAIVEEITRAGGRARAFRADVGDREAGQALVRQALDAFGQVDVLVNNAGIHLPGVGLADVGPADWERILRVNLSAPFYLIQAVLPHMRGRRAGHIVNLSSNVTQRYPATYGPYTVSKSGLEALTRILAKEEGRHGIRINAVAPGPIDTDMMAESLAAMGPERAAGFIASIPLGRSGRPEEIAGVVRFLVSEASSFLTGQVVYVNGGGPGG
jgi:3-oxoacyl-[acyl-carrier protein] reductase